MTMNKNVVEEFKKAKKKLKKNARNNASTTKSGKSRRTKGGKRKRHHQESLSRISNVLNDMSQIKADVEVVEGILEEEKGEVPRLLKTKILDSIKDYFEIKEKEFYDYFNGLQGGRYVVKINEDVKNTAKFLKNTYSDFSIESMKNHFINHYRMKINKKKNELNQILDARPALVSRPYRRIYRQIFKSIKGEIDGKLENSSKRMNYIYNKVGEDIGKWVSLSERIDSDATNYKLDVITRDAKDAKDAKNPTTTNTRDGSRKAWAGELMGLFINNF